MPMSLALIDLDHFKHVNDSRGHQAGDQVLVEVGRILRESTREYDDSCRFGGEEFALILPDTRLADAAALMERLRSRLEKHAFDVEGGVLHITASIGLAVSEAGSLNAEAIVRMADEALYTAKREGRNRVVKADGVSTNMSQ